MTSPKTYTSNQTAAITLTFASSIWGLTVVGATIIRGTQTVSALTVFSILVILSLVNLIFALKLIRPAFLVAIALWIIAMVGMLGAPGTTPWYAFTAPVYHLTFLIFHLMALAGIYFAYKSYQELK
jgi:hypothetical protein